MRAHFAKIPQAALLAVLLCALPAFAGGALETIDITGHTASPIAGHLNGKVIPIHWDTRCIPVQFRVNNTLDPIPNALNPPTGAGFLSVADAAAALQQSMDQWNQIPTSYINMQIVGTVSNPGLRGFDMKNELTFRTPAGFTAIASSPSIALIEDSNLVNGADIDLDGDSDVSSAITTCADVDGDGDIEFPAGFYKAGTILENDIQFNTKLTSGLRFTVLDSAVDTDIRSVDLRAVATHELGHSHGLSHVLNNTKSGTDGNGATMFPVIDTGDPAAELTLRSLDSDDIAWSSFFYPEGTAASGPAALQAGDVPFDAVYGLITGTVTHGVLNQPVAGASVSALDKKTGELFTTGFSGTTQLSFDPATGQVFIVSPEYNILDGKFTMPVTKGNWNVAVEPIDGAPVPANSVSNTAVIGAALGQHNFNEEFWNGDNEAAIEKSSGEAKSVHVGPAGDGDDGDEADPRQVNIVTNDEINISNFGSRDFVGFVLQPAGSYYAVQIPASQLSAILPGQDLLIHAGAFDTFVSDASVLPRFAEATLTTGTVTGVTATLNLSTPLERVTGFLGADNDFAPLYFKNPQELGKKVRQGIATGEIQNVFLVLRLPPTPFPGVSNLPPLIGLDGASILRGGGGPPNDVPILGLSFFSNDGVTFHKVANFNFRFSLIVSKAPVGDDDDE